VVYDATAASQQYAVVSGRVGKLSRLLTAVGVSIESVTTTVALLKRGNTSNSSTTCAAVLLLLLPSDDLYIYAVGVQRAGIFLSPLLRGASSPYMHCMLGKPAFHRIYIYIYRECRHA